MNRTLAALLAFLAAAPVGYPQDKQDKPLPPSEEFVEIKWDVQKDDRFDFKWSYDESLKIIRPPLPRTNGPALDENTDNTDKRDVIGEAYFKEN